MNIFLPFFSAVANGIGVSIDKFNLKRNGFTPRALILITFLVMTAVAGGYLLIARPVLPVFVPILFILLPAVFLVSFFQNIFEMNSLQALPLNTRQPIISLEPILTGVLAYLIFPSEGNILYVIGIFIGVPIVYWSVGDGSSWRISLAKGSGYAFAQIMFSALIDNLYKVSLFFISPPYLAFARVSGVFALSSLFFKSSWKEIPQRGLILSLAVGALFGVAAIARMYAVQQLGLNFTLLISLLEPGIIYLLSHLLLKEKLKWRPIFGSVAILCLIVAIQYL